MHSCITISGETSIDVSSTLQEDSYQKLLKKQKYKVNAKVWNRVSFGNVTYNNKKKED